MPQPAVTFDAGALYSLGSASIKPFVESIEVDVSDTGWFCQQMRFLHQILLVFKGRSIMTARCKQNC